MTVTAKNDFLKDFFFFFLNTKMKYQFCHHKSSGGASESDEFQSFPDFSHRTNSHVAYELADTIDEERQKVGKALEEDVSREAVFPFGVLPRSVDSKDSSDQRREQEGAGIADSPGRMGKSLQSRTNSRTDVDHDALAEPSVP